MLKVYIGCSLTHAPQSFIDKIEEFKLKLKSICLVLDFFGVNDENSPRDIYTHDITNCVMKCDLMVAICDEPSTGLGFEMATQISRKKPLLAFGHVSSKITRLILDPGLDGYYFYRYQNFDDIYKIIEDFLKK